MYSLADYIWMIADGARVAAYAGALRAQVQPGMRVLDLGAGFGFFSVVAARAGASHVDAVDTNPAIHLGPKIAAANDCADHITFHHADVSLLTLDEPADLLVADLRGPTPFGHRSLEVLMQARKRLLRAGGAIIAARDALFVAPCRAPADVRREIHAAHGQLGMNLEPVERVMFDTPMAYSVTPEELVAPGKPWLELDYRTLDRVAFQGQTEWSCAVPTTADGLAVWFDTDLGAGYGFSTAPGGSVVAYKQLFVPFRTPVLVGAGERLRVDLRVNQVGDNNLWEWRAAVIDHAGTHEREIIRQNSLAELIIDPATFTYTSPDARPALGARGRTLRDLLAHMDGETSVATLTARLHQAAPDLFDDLRVAEQFVATWTQAMTRLERGTD
jgi:predicted nicotinamide N-methyase